ncbi:hypothetical protein SDC9_133446 [bioreactor metagenome]|uniref:Uncharacterized protein n=1 Tax=bioreactor metagenome TaxID=1076179 RepID=A0A645DAZ4_9ZZZZ
MQRKVLFRPVAHHLNTCQRAADSILVPYLIEGKKAVALLTTEKEILMLTFRPLKVGYLFGNILEAGQHILATTSLALDNASDQIGGYQALDHQRTLAQQLVLVCLN